MQPRTMQTAADDGEWLEAAVRRRNAEPADLAQRVLALRERDLKWPVVIHCLKDNSIPGAWNAAMEVRVKTLTDPRVNMNGGQVLSTLHTEDVHRLWKDARERIDAAGGGGAAAAAAAMTAAGNAVLRDRKGRSATSAFALLMNVAQARGLGDLSAMTGEEYAMSSLAVPPPNARRRRK